MSVISCIYPKQRREVLIGADSFSRPVGSKLSKSRSQNWFVAASGTVLTRISSVVFGSPQTYDSAMYSARSAGEMLSKEHIYLVHLHCCQQGPTTQAPASFKCLAERNLSLTVNVPQAFQDSSYRCSAKQGASQQVQSSAPSHKTNRAKPESA
jgi:hypothetical protein